MIEASVMRTVWNDDKISYEVKAKGHAGAGKYGQDIVCAAVSVLMQTLANEVEEAARAGTVALGAVAHGDGWMKVEVTPTRESCNMVEAWVELVQDGLDALAESYPENVELVVNMMFADGKAPDPAQLPDMVSGKMNLQLFAEGGDGGSGAGETSQSAGADSSPDRRALGMEENSTLGEEENTAPDEAEGRDGESKGEEEKKLSPAERRKKFGQLMSGEYRAEAEEMMQQAVALAAKNLEASPEMRGLLEAIGEKYGTDATDLAALTEAVRNGQVKDDAYFERLAMEKGISVKTAREMDKLETQNKRLTAQQAAAQQMQREAEQRARIAAIHEEWNREAAALKERYPDFDQAEVLANPEVEKMMRAGCSMEAAYRAAYFDRIMAQQTEATARQVENGVTERIRQRGARPGENGTRPGGAVQTHLDVSSMSRKDREALEKRVLRGEIITL
ncbi:ribosomal-processing cysteine protease Prp [Faecalibacterium prausnitzii]|uniref:ribosomal-processing cysteine protease Prp n=1 Tax=Faecalibacterium prausnitzii TaxID=853 RepID=UPI0026654D3D|nr:ribosomal-processing cysteine protease Prp [Faecalibacterium prausnitzii]